MGKSSPVAEGLNELFNEMDIATSVRSAKKLTRAFGWNESHLNEAQDPLEMMRVMIDYFEFRVDKDETQRVFFGTMNTRYHSNNRAEPFDRKYTSVFFILWIG